MDQAMKKLHNWQTMERPATVIGKPARPIAGDTETQTTEWFTAEAGRVSSGIWQATAGVFRSDTTGYIEFCHIIEGHCRVVDPDGTVHALKAGDSFVMPEGYKGQWEVDHFVKKCYFVSVVAP